MHRRWEEPGGRGGSRCGKAWLVAGEDPSVSIGVRAGVSDLRSASKASMPNLEAIPAHRERSGGGGTEHMQVATCELEACLAWFDLGGGTVQMVGDRAPSQRITTLPVGAAYLK